MDCHQSLTLIVFLAVCFSRCSTSLDQHVLHESFYKDTCPNLASIIRAKISPLISKDPRMAASLLRLQFHDCFTTGCDASILLDDTTKTKGEKNALPNKNSARGFVVIDTIKDAVEEVCPETVSCADILALAAREAVFMVGGPYWSLPLGRRDATQASEAAANEELPSPVEPLESIVAKFLVKGLSLQDVVALSGAHTLGFARCSTFKDRLYNFKGSDHSDPSLNHSALPSLQRTCPNVKASDSKLVPLDSVTVNQFDNAFYKNLMNHDVLLQSDQALLGDINTASLVVKYAMNATRFAEDFAASMTKLANVGVLTGDDGEVRLDVAL